MKLIYLSKLIVLLILALGQANSQLFSALNQQKNVDKKSLFGRQSNLDYKFKQISLTGNKNNIFHNQPDVVVKANSLVNTLMPLKSEVASLFNSIEKSHDKPFQNIMKDSIVKLNKTQENSKIANANSNKTITKLKNDETIESINVDEIGVKNLKRLNKFSKLTKSLIKNEEKQINVIIGDWKKINQKTAEIGKIIRNYYPNLNITNSNLTEFEFLTNKIQDIQKLIVNLLNSKKLKEI